MLQTKSNFNITRGNAWEIVERQSENFVWWNFFSRSSCLPVDAYKHTRIDIIKYIEINILCFRECKQADMK